ncbi:MAG: GIY-YIG nuclease family protein [Proteobacteria bacterium]|nr:GIY-YIG nuclease family protein [Pseudomonadota bacterium]
MRSYWTYILTNVARNVMYVGVTNDLEKRVAQHRLGEGGLFTRRYNVHTLVYAEEHEQVEDAIAREKEIKGWRRSKKDALVESVNPTWADLFALGDAFKDPSLRSG